MFCWVLFSLLVNSLCNFKDAFRFIHFIFNLIIYEAWNKYLLKSRFFLLLGIVLIIVGFIFLHFQLNLLCFIMQNFKSSYQLMGNWFWVFTFQGLIEDKAFGHEPGGILPNIRLVNYLLSKISHWRIRFTSSYVSFTLTSPFAWMIALRLTFPLFGNFNWRLFLIVC